MINRFQGIYKITEIIQDLEVICVFYIDYIIVDIMDTTSMSLRDDWIKKIKTHI